MTDGAGSHSVSVVIPYGSRATNLDATLAALAAQRGAPPFEVVVVRCPAAEQHTAVMQRWSTILELQGVEIHLAGFAPATARNAGIAAAAGSLIVSLDDDMVVGPRFLRHHVDIHAASPDPVACIGPRRFVSGRDSPIGLDIFERLWAQADLAQSASNRPGQRLDWRWPESRRIRSHPHPYHLFLGCNASYRREDAHAVGGWDTAFDGAYGYEDVAFGFDLHSGGAAIHWEPRAIGLHLEDPTPSTWKSARGANLARICAMIPGYGDFRASAGLAAARPPRARAG